jgi:hypothetical protein
MKSTTSSHLCVSTAFGIHIQGRRVIVYFGERERNFRKGSLNTDFKMQPSGKPGRGHLRRKELLGWKTRFDARESACRSLEKVMVG